MIVTILYILNKMNKINSPVNINAYILPKETFKQMITLLAMMVWRILAHYHLYDVSNLGIVTIVFGESWT